jgi:hypothetical protein
LKTAYILVTHLDSVAGLEQVELGGGCFTRIPQNGAGRRLIEKCRDLFPGANAQLSDWLFERIYAAVPPPRVGNDPPETLISLTSPRTFCWRSSYCIPATSRSSHKRLSATMVAAPAAD